MIKRSWILLEAEASHILPDGCRATAPDWQGTHPSISPHRLYLIFFFFCNVW